MYKKTKLKISSVILLMVILAFTLLGCNSTKKIDDFYENLEKQQNCTLSFEIGSSAAKLKLTIKNDGNNIWMSSFLGSPEIYYEKIEEKTFKYTKVNEKWIREETKVIENEDKANIQDYEKLFKSENYEYSKDEKKYIMKEDVDIEDLNHEKLTLDIIDNNHCVFEGEIESEGIVVTIKIEIKDVGSTKVKLPKIEEDHEETK